MTILVDRREGRSGVPEALVRLEASIEVVQLAVADYVPCEGVGLERKTISDLHRSLVSGRLWSQIASLRKDFVTPYLVVEGASLDAGGVSPAGIRGALLSVLRVGVPVIRTTTPFDTARWILALRTVAGDGRAARRPRRSRSRPPSSPATVLTSIVGISPAIARRLLDEFGTVAAVAAATPAELASIQGIGPARARALSAILSGTSREARSAGPPPTSASL